MRVFTEAIEWILSSIRKYFNSSPEPFESFGEVLVRKHKVPGAKAPRLRLGCHVTIMLHSFPLNKSTTERPAYEKQSFILLFILPDSSSTTAYLSGNYKCVVSHILGIQHWLTTLKVTFLQVTSFNGFLHENHHLEIWSYSSFRKRESMQLIFNSRDQCTESLRDKCKKYF